MTAVNKNISDEAVNETILRMSDQEVAEQYRRALGVANTARTILESRGYRVTAFRGARPGNSMKGFFTAAQITKSLTTVTEL